MRQRQQGQQVAMWVLVGELLSARTSFAGALGIRSRTPGLRIFFRDLSQTTCVV